MRFYCAIIIWNFIWNIVLNNGVYYDLRNICACLNTILQRTVYNNTIRTLGQRKITYLSYAWWDHNLYVHGEKGIWKDISFYNRNFWTLEVDNGHLVEISGKLNVINSVWFAKSPWLTICNECVRRKGAGAIDRWPS